MSSAKERAAVLRITCPRRTWNVTSLMPSAAAACLLRIPPMTRGKPTLRRSPHATAVRSDGPPDLERPPLVLITRAHCLRLW
jgi:hypothetical protein